jgi:hypothetical protein
MNLTMSEDGRNFTATSLPEEITLTDDIVDSLRRRTQRIFRSTVTRTDGGVLVALIDSCQFVPARRHELLESLLEQFFGEISSSLTNVSL